jgi:hypothetical protein
VKGSPRAKARCSSSRNNCIPDVHRNDFKRVEQKLSNSLSVSNPETNAKVCKRDY